MAYQSLFFDTQLPDIIIDEIVKEFSKIKTQKSTTFNGDSKVRNADNSWVNVQNWISGFIWYYITLANRKNFLYDIDGFDSDILQYSEYKEGQYYTWHCDDSIGNRCNLTVSTKFCSFNDTDFLHEKIVIQNECSRKLSFSLQLSDEQDYEGGELQFLDDANSSYYAPKKRGTLIIFDSRAKHRVKKIKSGVRKSLVGWVNGPRWK